MSKLENEQSQSGYTNNFIDTEAWIPDRRKSCLCLHKEAHGDRRTDGTVGKMLTTYVREYTFDPQHSDKPGHCGTYL